MANSAIASTVVMMEGMFAGQVEAFAATEGSQLDAALGITVDPNDNAAAARVARQRLFGLANLGIAHFTAGTPAPAKK